MPTTVDATTSLEVDDLLDSLCDLETNKIIDLIIELDRRAASLGRHAPSVRALRSFGDGVREGERVITARILADSLAPCGERLTTMEWTYPRAIHSEIMTHRALTKSSASSRAIPVEKLIQRIIDDPWIPMYIGANQKGMQAGEELSPVARSLATMEWLRARDNAVASARLMIDWGAHKQVVNRLLEPWMHITVIVSGTSWTNFFGLRDHPMAEPHFQHLARAAKEAMASSAPKRLKTGEWHLPLIHDEDREALSVADLVRVSVGRCARVSYLTHDGRRDHAADIELHDRLVVQQPAHAAPAEHVAQALDWPSWYDEWPAYFVEPLGGGAQVSALQDAVIAMRHSGQLPQEETLYAEAALAYMRSGNFLGFRQYRKTLPNEHIGGLVP